MRILLDEDLPRRLAELLVGHEVSTVQRSGWAGIQNGRLLGRELGPHGVLVNAVAPGPTLTPMYEQLPALRKEGVMKSVYTGRICQPEEVAQAVLWLGAQCPEYVSGTTLDVNNGSYPR